MKNNKKFQNKMKGLTSILERGEDGKPKLNLIPLERTAVNVPTEKDSWELMRVYERGGWKWREGNLPTQFNFWIKHKKRTCVATGVDYLTGGVFNEGKFGSSSKNFYLGEDWQVIKKQEFYDKQEPKITPEIIKEINEWFYGKIKF